MVKKDDGEMVMLVNDGDDVSCVDYACVCVSFQNNKGKRKDACSPSLGGVDRVVCAPISLEAIHLAIPCGNVHVVHPLHVHRLSRVVRVLKRTRRSLRRHLARLRGVHMSGMRTTRKQNKPWISKHSLTNSKSLIPSPRKYDLDDCGDGDQ